MKLRDHFFNRRREMKVLLILLLFLLPMGVVGVAKVEALERREESTDHLPSHKDSGRRGDLAQARIVALERAHKIQMFVRLEVLMVMRNRGDKAHLAAAVREPLELGDAVALEEAILDQNFR
jgi:hypothetical protein